MRLFKHKTGVGKSRSTAPKAVLRLEALETRLAPYAVSGNSWLQPQLISLSFVPDGTNLGGVTSNLFATMNAKWPAAVWQKEILRAAQVWAQQTNINFTIVADDGSASGSGSYQQGSGNFGDIRIGAWGSSGSWLGMAQMPQPACNYSLAGDWNLNASKSWVINSSGGYDLFTVSAHETGHGLGLLHSTVSSAVMYGSYTGIKNSLRTDDIAGIRAIYSGGSARAQDGYDAAGSNGTFGAASDVTSSIGGDLTALVTGLDITTVSDLDYLKVTVPQGTTGSMEVKIQSSGLSLLSPLVRVYDAAQVEIGSASGLNQYGATLTVNIGGVSAGQVYYIKMDGADNTAFGTGAYAMTLNFGGSATPSVPLPNTQTPNGNPIQCSGGMASEPHDPEHGFAHDHDHGTEGRGHGFGPAPGFDPAVQDASALALVQVLHQLPETRVAAPAPAGQQLAPRPAAATVAVFQNLNDGEPGDEVATGTKAEPQVVDALFANLFE